MCKIVHGKNSHSYKKLCNFTPYIVKEVIFDDGIEQKRVLHLGGIFENGTKLPTIQINVDEFSDLNWIIKKWGISLILESGYKTKDYIRTAIQCTNIQNNTEIIYSHLGFKKHNDKWIYIHGDRCLGDNSIKCTTNFISGNYTLNSTSNNNFASYDLLQSNLVKDEILYPLVALAYLSPLNEFFKLANFEPKLIINLFGRTGSMKSSLASLILSHFGYFTNTTLPFTFRDTNNSIIKRCYYLKDTLTVIDDFHPSSQQDEKRMIDIYQSIARGFGDKAGRKRMNNAGELMNSYQPQGNAIVTGETLANIGESGTARFISLELDKNDINTQILSDFQSKAYNGDLVKSMSTYIEYILSCVNDDEQVFVNSLNILFKNIRQKYTDHLIDFSVHGRIIESVSWLYCSLNLYFFFLKYKKVIDTNTESNLNEKAFNILLEVAKNQATIIKEDKPTEIFINKFKSLVESNKIYFKASDCSLTNINNNSQFVGYEDDEYYYIIFEVLYSSIKKLCTEQNECFSISQKALLKQLANENLIFTQNGKNSFTKRFKGDVIRCVWLRKSEIQN